VLNVDGKIERFRKRYGAKKKAKLGSSL